MSGCFFEKLQLVPINVNDNPRSHTGNRKWYFNIEIFGVTHFVTDFIILMRLTWKLITLFVWIETKPRRSGADQQYFVRSPLSYLQRPRIVQHQSLYISKLESIPASAYSFRDCYSQRSALATALHLTTPHKANLRPDDGFEDVHHSDGNLEIAMAPGQRPVNTGIIGSDTVNGAESVNALRILVLMNTFDRILARGTTSSCFKGHASPILFFYF